MVIHTYIYTCLCNYKKEEEVMNLEVRGMGQVRVKMIKTLFVNEVCKVK